jgi:hypothetical protein
MTRRNILHCKKDHRILASRRIFAVVRLGNSTVAIGILAVRHSERFFSLSQAVKVFAFLIERHNSNIKLYDETHILFFSSFPFSSKVTIGHIKIGRVEILKS